jgi:hypothetical protein
MKRTALLQLNSRSIDSGVSFLTAGIPAHFEQYYMRAPREKLRFETAYVET